MWLNRKVYDDLRDKLVAAEAEARGQAGALRTVQANLDFMRVRLNQLEQERAILIERMFGVKVPVPEIVKVADPFDNHKFNEVFSFEDVGDERAAQLGIQHDPDGIAVYTR